LTEQGLQAVIDSISSVIKLHWQYFIDTVVSVCMSFQTRTVSALSRISNTFSGEKEL